MTARDEYEYLKSNYELFDLFPDFDGEWEADREQFEKYWEQNNIAINNIHVYNPYFEEGLYDENEEI